MAALLAHVWASTALGQIRGDLVESGGNNSGLRIDLLIESSEFGELSAEQGRGGSILGTARVMAFPAEAPLTGIVVESWYADVEPASASFEFVEGSVAVDVTLLEYEARLLESGQAVVGGIGPPENFQIDSAEYEVGATVRLVSVELGLDVTLHSRGKVRAPFAGRIVLAAGSLFLGYTPPPEITLAAAPDDLPAGVTAVEVGLSMDAGNTNYHGPAEAAMLGDSDLDGDVDLFDFSFADGCIADMGNLLCALHDFDGSGVITLVDLGGLQVAFSPD